MPERRRIESAAFVLPIFGAALIVPPIINVFNVEVRVFGVPLEVVYFFAVWVGLVAGAVQLSRVLPRDDRVRPPLARRDANDGGGG